MEAYGLYDFTKRHENELDFAANEHLLVTSVIDNDWYEAENRSGQGGWVPVNFVALTDDRWFDRAGTRATTENKLVRNGLPEGSYVVRPSNNVVGKFSITVKIGNNVQHFGILRNERGQYHIWEDYFTSINQLVGYYKHDNINRKGAYICLRDPHFVKVLYDYDPQEGGDYLKLSAGDIIEVLSEDPNGWWRGVLNNRTGLFPNTYVTPVDS